MKFNAKREEEITKFENLEPGRYPFTVLESDEKASKSTKNAGKLMFALKLNVHGKDFDKHVYDYFADWFSEWKLKHFFDTTQHQADYESGEADATFNGFQGWTGSVEIGVEQNPQYGEKNIIIDYIVPEEKSKSSKPVIADPAGNENDDVPF